MAAGLPPEELLKSLHGKSRRITPFKFMDFYYPNWKEVFTKGWKLGLDALTLYPGLARGLMDYIQGNYRKLSRETFLSVVRMLAEGFSTRVGRRGAYLHWDRVNGRLRPRKGARLVIGFAERVGLWRAHGRRAMQSTSTSAPTARAVTPMVVRAGRRSSGK